MLTATVGCVQNHWIQGIVACVMQGSRFRIVVVSPKSPKICLDFPCSGLEQLLFLRDVGMEEKHLMEKCAQFLY